MNDSQVVEVIQPPPGLQCLQLMLSPKGIGTALVTIYDIGLVPPVAASAVVMHFFYCLPVWSVNHVKFLSYIKFAVTSVNRFQINWHYQ